MKKPRNTSTAGRRVVRAHKGSVLIMVVALLLLLALMGTAWLSTTRNDRGASVANVANVQIDLLVQGVSNLTSIRIADGVFGRQLNGGAQSVYRPWTFLDPFDASAPQSTFVNFDWIVVPSTQTNGGNPLLSAVMCFDRNWLASRAPVGDNNDHPYWPSITAALGSRQIGSPINPTDSVKVFESPYVYQQNPDPPQPSLGQAGVYTGEYVNRTYMQPTSLMITATDGSVRTYPAFLIGGGYYLAADTDGDGIADAGLWPLPLGEQNGVKYYAAVRIIDNNSAINASVASKFAESSDGPVNLNNFIPDLFPTNVDLWGLLGGNNDNDRVNQLNYLNAYRFGNILTATTPSISLGAYDDVNNVVRADMAGFLSPYDALWHQLGMRIDNPGMSQIGGNVWAPFRAVSIGDQMALARGFVVAPMSGSSSLETRLANTLVNNSPALPYLPSDAVGWFRNNFKYINITGQANDLYSRRALMVARNGVAQAIPDAGALAAWQLINAGNYYPGNPPTPTADITPGDTNPNTTVTAGLPTKVSLNTGNFRELCRAYWYVMADRLDVPNDPTPFYNSSNDPSTQVAYLGMDFNETNGLAGSEINPWRMFRSSLRPGGGGNGPMLLPPQQLLLRSALAAANTMELRWGPMAGPGSNMFRRYLNCNVLVNNNDTSINGKAYVSDIPLALKDGTQALGRVFGNKPQPFIAEVYANNDGAMHNVAAPAPDPNAPPG
ncbi:MAG: hypothetical protein ACHRHE_18405, partial [Tepidisphaerales bacterium]